MVLIEFPDRNTEVKGLAVLMSRFSGKVLRGGLHIVPEPALKAMTDAHIPYTVKGPATYEQEVAALRGDAPDSASTGTFCAAIGKSREEWRWN